MLDPNQARLEVDVPGEGLQLPEAQPAVDTRRVKVPACKFP
jgi:hypothetical protein